jgi:hypothetical protein
MASTNRVHQRQTQAIAGPRAALIQAHKTLANMGQLIFRDAATRIGNRNNNVLIAAG